MKIRNGFVSNSSSSSFVINKTDLTYRQIRKIKDHSYYAKRMGMESSEDAWNIYESESTIQGDTMMDNFDMAEYLAKIGIDMKKVRFDEF